MKAINIRDEVEKIIMEELDITEIQTNNIEELGDDIMDWLSAALDVEMQDMLQYYDNSKVLDRLYECKNIDEIINIFEKLQVGIQSGNVTLLADVEDVDFNELVMNAEKYDLKEDFFD